MSKKQLKSDPHAKREAKRYDNPIASREMIMQFLEDLGTPATRDRIAAALKIRGEDQEEALRRRLIAMLRDGQLLRDRRNRYVLVNELDLIRGRVVGHKDGFGFLIVEHGDDIYLPQHQMRLLFPGDIVLARTSAPDARGRREGNIVEVVERNTHQIVGRYFKERGVAFVQPEHKDIYQDILIADSEGLKASSGQYVVAEIVSQPSRRRQATGRIVEVLGDHMAPGIEIEAAIRAFEIPHKWPEAVSREVRRFSADVKEEDKKDRQDIRDLPLVTIDGEDAKDFDDAVYCEATKNGWHLWVAIADVSHYVAPDSELDREAIMRGNSVYFPGRVVPMLPEELSNGLCSLKPNVDRLCMVCEMEIDKKGKLTRYRFYDAVMHSHARLTYTQVWEMLQGKIKGHAKLMPHIKALYELYKVLHKRRETRGALEFETTETKIVFDKDRKIKEIVAVVRNDAHRIIEECMLLANVSASRFLTEHKVPFLYRVHEGPKTEKLAKLQEFLRAVGLTLPGKDNPTPQDYATCLRKAEGRPDEGLIQMVMLRSLQQAVYTPEEKGHFGLAYDVYTHFTSPIRRYPDLLVHRAIRHVLQHKPANKFYCDMEAMVGFGDHCSMTERRADDATRDVVSWLKCQYMQDKLGEVFDGVISGVTNFGIFVQLNNIYVEGLVHITALKNDYYTFDEVHHVLRGKSSKSTYRLGDTVKVQVASVNLDDRKIDFDLASS